MRVVSKTVGAILSLSHLEIKKKKLIHLIVFINIIVITKK